MFAARNHLLAPRALGGGGGGSPVYDATGVGISGHDAGDSFSHTAELDADVILAIEAFSGGDPTPTTIQYNGTDLVPLGDPVLSNNVSTYGWLFFYRGERLGTGSPADFDITFPGTVYYAAQSVSAASVNSVGAIAANTGQGVSPTSGLVSIGAGDLIVAAIGVGGGVTGLASSPTGGTNLDLINEATNHVSLVLSTATADDTFGCTASKASCCWGTAAVVLS